MRPGASIPVSVPPRCLLIFAIAMLTIASPACPNQTPGIPEWQCPRGEKIVRFVTARLRHGHEPDLVVWTHPPSGGETVRVFGCESGRWTTLAESKGRPLWRLEIGDVNGDGLDEIVAGLWQRSKLDPKPARRIYVYSLNHRDRCFKPLWRGSALCRPFRDFLLIRGNGDCNLAAIETEQSPSDHEWLTIYTWHGFGFRRQWNTPVAGRIARFGRHTSETNDTLWLERLSEGRRQHIHVFENQDGTYRSSFGSEAACKGTGGTGVE